MTRPILLLALLPMFIGSCQKAPDARKLVETYDKHCSQPLAGWRTEKDGVGQRPVFSVKLDETGRVSWNRVSEKQTFREYMERVGELNPEPQMILEIDGKAPCSRVKEIRNIMAASRICQGKYALCSEGRNWHDWERRH